MGERGLRIFLLTTETGYSPNRTPVTIGSFNVFVENSIAYMGGFAIGGAQRGFRLSRLLITKLIEEYGRYEIVCKTNPTDQIMRKVLIRGGFKNKVDRFENKKLWSYWSCLPK